MKVRRFISDLNGYLTRAPCSVHVVGRNWIGVAWGRLLMAAQVYRVVHPWHVRAPYGTTLAQGLAAQEPLARASCTTVAAGPWLQGRTNWRHGVRWRYHGIAADGRCKSCRPTAFRRVRPPEERVNYGYCRSQSTTCHGLQRQRAACTRNSIRKSCRPIDVRGTDVPPVQDQRVIHRRQRHDPVH